MIVDYDYIVVGAGSSGAVVITGCRPIRAAKVLLLEAGAADNPWTRLPVGSARLIGNPAANWLYSGEPEPTRRVGASRCRAKAARRLEAINGMAFVRGQDAGFDT